MVYLKVFFAGKLAVALHTLERLLVGYLDMLCKTTISCKLFVALDTLAQSVL